MRDFIREVNARRQVPHSDLNSQVKRVAVMLSSSRAGSSLIKHVLAAHPDIAALDGEIGPYLALTENGFGFNSDSDAIGELANMRELADNIFDDLSVPVAEIQPFAPLRTRWARRLMLQFPILFTQGSAQQKLMENLDEALLHVKTSPSLREEKELQKIILSKVFSQEPWRINYYDGQSGHPRNGASAYFNEPFKIEEPPFVMPKLYRRQFTSADAGNKVLLFKTPSDAYRLGIYEQLFPNAEIKYIHLNRGFAQSVNGLMDGWLSPVGFFAHDMERVGVQLEIKGYSDCTSFSKRWWKFDLPPNWREFCSANLEDVCLNQWLSSHRAILASDIATLRLSFEEFITAPATVAKKVTDYLGLAEMKIPPSLPVTMATDAPQSGRWIKREQLLLRLAKQPQVRAMMDELGYSMQPDTWL